MGVSGGHLLKPDLTMAENQLSPFLERVNGQIGQTPKQENLSFAPVYLFGVFGC